VQSLADFVVERRIPALFVESSVSPRGINAVQKAVEARGFEATLGGTLYGDALGNRGSPTGTYVGALRHNIDTIVEGLLPDDGVEAWRHGGSDAKWTPLHASTHP
jgi:manganese/zinc/iron transport system substrate-binding protein